MKKFIPKHLLKFLRKFKYALEDYFRRINRLPQGSILSADKVFQMRMIKKNSEISYKKNVLDSMEMINKKLAFDVGAFTGNSIDRIRSLGYSEIVCFEPDPDNFSLLAKRYSSQRGITLLNFAVSEKSKLMLALTSNKDLPWLNTLNQDWISGTRHENLFLRTHTHQVETITLDDGINLYGEVPAYIKIDVEGHELSVLSGLSHKPELLSFEWISERINKNVDALKCLERLGFQSFYICIQEELPNFNLDGLNLLDCIAELKVIQSNDIMNDNWGNIFTR